MLRTLPAFCLGLTLVALPAAAQVAINSSGAPPNPNAILDVSATNKGFLAPRVSAFHRLTGNLATGVQALLVYQTNDTVVAGVSQPRGYYYFEGGWQRVAGTRVWNLGGNNDINAAVDYLGTSTAQPLVLRTANSPRAALTATGSLVLHTSAAAPTTNERMLVQGAVRVGSTTADLPGSIRYQDGHFEGYAEGAWHQLDNTMGTRKSQQYLLPISQPCNPPSSTTSVTAAPRAWPILGPTSGFANSALYTRSPYGSLWEDTRRQYLYRAEAVAERGICGPIRALAFDVYSDGGVNATYHFFKLAMKNSSLTQLTDLELGGLTNVVLLGDCPTNYPIPGNGNVEHASTCGNDIVNGTGWVNIHNFNLLPGGFTWTPGSSLLVEAAMDNQRWLNVAASSVMFYSSGYSSLAYVFCDACGHTTMGGAICGWAPGNPPTAPQTGTQAPSGMIDGWGWKGGWDITSSTSLRECSGDPYAYEGGYGVESILPRLALLADYTSGAVPIGRADYQYAHQGVMVGDATWAASADGAAPHRKFKGPGTISAQRSIWGGNVLLSDYVFDVYYDGVARPEDAHAADYAPTGLKHMANFVERHHHLPTIDGRAEWNAQGPFSLDKLSTQLWVTVEEQALYIKELNERMEALQRFLLEKRLQELKKP